MPTDGLSRATLPSVNPRPGQPLYASVKQALIDAIETGYFNPQDRLPSTKELSEQMSVSLVTAHRALRELVAAGVIERRQGRGTFIIDRSGQAERKFRISLVLHRESSMADFYHSRLLEGMRQASADQGLELTVNQYGGSLANDLDGYLLINPLPDDLKNIAHHLPARSIRMVVGARTDDDALPWVDVDNRMLARLAVEHLHSLGHRRIGYLGSKPAVSNSRDRWDGFSSACRNLNLPVDPRLTVHAPGWRVDGSEKMRLVQLLSGKDRPTAVFAGGYYFSLDVYEVAQTLGLRMPEELSVVGVDDPPSAAYISPPLTTIHQPLMELGHAAVTAVIDAIRHPDEPITNRTLWPELVIRKSSAHRG